jgi:hypothetical protein
MPVATAAVMPVVAVMPVATVAVMPVATVAVMPVATVAFTSGCLFAAVALAGILLVRHYVA